MYDYNATVVAVHDGDTVKVDVDLGFDAHYVTWIRLVGINAPELATAAGVIARNALTVLLPAGTKVLLQSSKASRPVPADKFGGRWDADLLLTVNAPPLPSVSAWMIANGLAVPWDGKGPKP